MMNTYKNNNFIRKTAAIFLSAAVCVSSFSMVSFADTEKTNSESVKTESVSNDASEKEAEIKTAADTANEDAGQKYDLSDNIVDFEEIEELVKKGNPTYLSAYNSASEALTDMSDSFGQFKMQMEENLDTIDETLDGLVASQKAISGMSSLEVEFMGVTMPKQAALSALSEGIEQARAGRKQIRSALYSTAKGITDGKKKVDKALKPVADQITSVVESLVISYKQLETNRKMVEKQVSLYEATLKTYKNMRAQGMSVDSEVSSYENQLSEAKNSLESVDAGLSQLKGAIKVQLGFDQNADIVIAEIPDPDKNYLENRDVEMDRKKTVTGNDTVRAAGKVDYYSSTGFKIRDKEENEALGKAYAAFDELIAGVNKNKSLYETSELTLKKAELTRDMAKRQKKLGLTGEAAYEGQQMACISYEASAELARLNFIQSIRQYHWSVNGLFSF